MSSVLKEKTIHALLWSFVESMGLQAVRVLIGVVLARLLLPQEFGLIAMLMVFIAVTESFLDGGFGSALIQKRDATETEVCSIFYFNVVIGVLAAVLMCLAAPWIAAFYRQPTLTPLARLLSLSIVVHSLGLIQSTLLTKQIDFKTQTKVSLAAGVVSGVLGIALALVGCGVWSLAVQHVSGATLRTGYLWLLSPWRPAFLFSLDSLRSLFGFGSRLLASNVLSQVFDNLYYLVIGRLFAATDVAFFACAKTLQELPSATLSAVVARVTFPVFTRMQDDPARIKGGLRKALTVLVLVNFPLMIGLAAVAKPLVLLLLTEKWAPSIPYLQWFCMVGLLYPLHLMNLNVLTAIGRSDLFLRLEVFKKILIVVSIVVTWRWGVLAMIYGMVLTSVVAYYLNSYFSASLIGYSIWEQVRDVAVYLVLAVVMGAAVYGIGMLPLPGLGWTLAVQTTGGTACYVLLCRLFRVGALVEVLAEVCERFPRLKTGAAV